MTFTEPTVQHNSLNDIKNEIYSSVEGNQQTFGRISNKKKNWRTIVVNANSIRGKQTEIEIITYNLKLCDIIGTETRHGKEHATPEFPLKRVRHKLHRNDIPDCGGVLIAVK